MRIVITVITSLAFLLVTAAACTRHPSDPPPRYVWYCHIAGGQSCIGDLIRCWDRKRLDWVADAHCSAVVEKPENLVHNQSYPPVSRSALLP